jgi:hypothetical protein
MFGTDYPYRSSAEHVKGVNEFFSTEADRNNVNFGNVIAMMPQLRAG